MTKKHLSILPQTRVEYSPEYYSVRMAHKPGLKESEEWPSPLPSYKKFLHPNP